MLDMLGNVFGRSKKDKAAGSQSTASSAAESASSEGFAVVGQDASGQVPFIYPTMLTNEMLRPSPASANTASSTPFSTDAASFAPVPYNSQNANTWNSHNSDNLTLFRSNMNGISHINAMDQVPFVPHAAFDSSQSPAGHDSKADDIRRCYAAIERVTGLLAAPSQSEYNFTLERGVIRETSASSWQKFN